MATKLLFLVSLITALTVAKAAQGRPRAGAAPPRTDRLVVVDDGERAPSGTE